METHDAAAFDRVFDWVIAAVLLVGAGLFALGGATLYVAITPDIATELVQDGDIQADFLSEAELIDATVAISEWLGIGLMVTAVLLLVVAVAVVDVHRRVRDRGDPTPLWILAVAGSLVGSVLSFIPFSQAVGGGVAGYLLDRGPRSGAGVGALSGVFTILPALVIMGFTLVGIFEGLPNDAAAAVAGITAVSLLVGFVFVFVVSAVGGFAGGWIREERA